MERKTKDGEKKLHLEEHLKFGTINLMLSTKINEDMRDMQHVGVGAAEERIPMDSQRVDGLLIRK
jgi:hypothetical protein